MRISIFFPAYNEEKNIGAAVRKADEVMRALVAEGIAQPSLPRPNGSDGESGGIAGAFEERHRDGTRMQIGKRIEDYEIIVVDDGSTDSTGFAADTLALSNPRVKVVRHDANRGYGAALWSGIQAARYELVFFTDADLQFRMEEIRRLLEYAPEYAVVLGYRAPRRDSFMRLLNAWGWNLLNRVLFGLKVRDIDCAFKLFDRRMVAGLPLETRGAAMSAEMLIRLQREGLQFKEVAVTHLPRLKGNPTGAKPAVIIRAFKELFKLYMGDLGQQETAYVQAGKFGLVGVVNTLVDVATYFVLTRFMPFFPTHILTAKFTTFFFGTVCSFALNRRFTFRIRGRLDWAELAKFYSSVALTITINVLSLYVFNTLFGIYDLVAVGMSTVLTFVVGFTFSKLWVFRSKLAGKLGAPISGTFAGLGSGLGGRNDMMRVDRLRPDKVDWSEVARASNDL